MVAVLFGCSHRGSDREQLMCDRQGGVFVAGAEDVEVVEHVVELVDADAGFEAVVVGVGEDVGVEAGLWEAAEELHHGDVGPRVADGDGGVDDGDAGGVRVGVDGGDGVAGPEVAVDQGGGGVAWDEVLEAVDDALQGF